MDRELTDYIMRWDPYQQLVQDSREHKYRYHRHPTTPASPNQGEVDMSRHEPRDGFIPRRPVDAYAGTIPPIRIKLSITKLHDLAKSVEEGLEEGEESGEPDY